MKLSAALPLVVRVLFGGLFLVSGIGKLVPLFPVPELTDPAAAFIGGLVVTGYFMPLLGLVEVVCGAAVIVGRFVPLSLVILAPVVVHVALFHLLLEPGLGVTLFLVGAQSYLAWVYRDAFRPLLEARTPAAAARGDQRSYIVAPSADA